MYLYLYVYRDIYRVYELNAKEFHFMYASTRFQIRNFFIILFIFVMLYFIFIHFILPALHWFYVYLLCGYDKLTQLA